MLDPGMLDAIKVKAAGMRVELEAAQKARSAAGAGVAGLGGEQQRAVDAGKRMDELYEQVERIRGVAGDVPALVVRLKTLEQVHAGAASFASRLRGMEAAVGALGEELRANGQVLGSLREGLAENVIIMQQNVKLVNQRISEIAIES